MNSPELFPFPFPFPLSFRFSFSLVRRGNRSEGSSSSFSEDDEKAEKYFKNGLRVSCFEQLNPFPLLEQHGPFLQNSPSISNGARPTLAEGVELEVVVMVELAVELEVVVVIVLEAIEGVITVEVNVVVDVDGIWFALRD